MRIKLVKCLEGGEKYDSAVEYIREVLELPPYCDNYEWYTYTADVLQVTSIMSNISNTMSVSETKSHGRENTMMSFL